MTLFPFLLEIDVSLLGLTAQITNIQGICLAVFDKMRSTLAELKMDMPGSALRPNIQHPLIIKRTGVLIGLTADNHQFNAIQMWRKVYVLNQWLTDDIFVPDRELLKNRKANIRSGLVFHRTAHGDILVAGPPSLPGCRP